MAIMVFAAHHQVAQGTGKARSFAAGVLFGQCRGRFAQPGSRGLIRASSVFANCLRLGIRLHYWMKGNATRVRASHDDASGDSSRRQPNRCARGHPQDCRVFTSFAEIPLFRMVPFSEIEGDD